MKNKSNANSSTNLLLSRLLAEDVDNTLWLADENALSIMQSMAALPAMVSNRHDIASAARKREAQCWYNDWDLQPAFSAQQFSRVIYRISKEKPVIHHLLNQVAQLLPSGGTLTLLGQKNDGIKTIANNAAMLFGNKSIEKHGADYLVHLTKQKTPDSTLETQNYTALRPIDEFAGLIPHSKPGTFGWNKIDAGSAFLLEHLAAIVEQKTAKRILDLGCGYGLLSLVAQSLPQLSKANWLATDNCAAAIEACSFNTKEFNADVFAGDCGLDGDGQPLREKVELVLCNPPFHQGFDVSGDLTSKFLVAMQRWLNSGGCALVVVNQFVGIEKKAAPLFKSVKCLADNGSFKVMLLTR